MIPCRKSWYPSQGTYIAFSIDIEATLLHYEYPMKSYEELKKYFSKTYVGVVTEVSRLAVFSIQLLG